ncbi:MAG TPA: VOC family protein [Ktedonobacteraceae bacterium]|nr:VOC family protein [Ktedonobacteraceae bacterium]
MESDNPLVPKKSGLPTIRGVEHIGLTVPDLDEATRFFVQVLGCEVVYTMGPFPYKENWFDLNPELLPQIRRTIRTLSCGNGAHIELFEFTAPDQRKQMPRNIDYGGHHVAFYVDDMDAAIAYLKDKGVKFYGGKKYGSGPEAGKDSTFIHFCTPWGLILELVSYPNGRAYEQEKPPIWRPS